MGIMNNADLVLKEVRAAIERGDAEAIEGVLPLIWESGDITQYVDLLNELLINPNHRSHQLIAKSLQDAAPSPSTVPFIRKALESNFDYLAYTCSETSAIAKWFSWLLCAIGTKEAIELMREYSNSADESIASEMQYRLKRC
jgi:hypothetical protein